MIASPMRTAARTLFFGLALAVAAAAQPAQAAPQILAALATLDGLKFHCTDGWCRADLSTYCLQRNRPAPSRGQAYVPAVPEAFTLVFNKEGTASSMPAGDHVTFVESRGFMSVSAIIEEKHLKALSESDVRLVVSANAALLPVPDASDKNPITPEEVAFATQSLRELGNTVVDRMPEATTAQLLAHVAGRLPENGVLPPSASAGFWENAIGDELPQSLPAPSVVNAKARYERCFGEVDNLRFGSMRGCLEWQHDDLIRDLNIDYWQQQPGS